MSFFLFSKKSLKFPKRLKSNTVDHGSKNKESYYKVNKSLGLIVSLQVILNYCINYNVALQRTVLNMILLNFLPGTFNFHAFEDALAKNT